MGFVLVTNAQQRKALSFARSVGEKGFDVACCDTTFCNPVRFSKYCKKFYKQTDKGGNTKDFLLDLVKKGHVDVLVPMDDDSTEVVINNREVFSKYCNFALPRKESFETALYKDQAVKVAQKAGVRCPDTVFTCELWEKALKSTISFKALLEQEAEKIGYPVVIKPVRSSGSRGITVVKSPDLLYDAFNKVHGTYPYPLLQSYVKAKDKYDVCLIYNRKGECRASFVQKELRHYPVGIGPSTVQQSVYRPDILEKALKIMEHYSWTGVVELEFLVDDQDRNNDQNIVFMEINPRFWASLETAVLSGVDFPSLYVDIANKGDCASVFDYTPHKTVRWFWPGDLLYFLTVKDKKNVIPGFFTGRRKGISDDIYRPDDPFPVMGVWLQSVYYLIRKERRNFVIRRS